MSELKTKESDRSVNELIDTIEDPVKHRDCRELLALMENATGKLPRLWGDSMVGFGHYDYVYASGRRGRWFVTGFAPRKRNLCIYIMPGFERVRGLMERLGKHSTGKSCLYIKRLDDVDRGVLEQIVADSVTHMHEIYRCD